ncbi:MAG TPA: hypothetical protein VGX50_09490 [Longimicrobium sp.]|jgi:hypothetical protein|nr:hypothetical protein [Longimicrobium sp.]
MAYTQTSVAPLAADAFWVRYSNLLLSAWSIPGVKAELQSNPAQALGYFDLATVPGATFDIKTSVTSGEGGFDDQYERYQEGHKTGHYVLVVPDSYPGLESVSSDSLVAAASDGAKCCCCCCPCCSCF